MNPNMNLPAFIKCHTYTTVYEQGKHTPVKGEEVFINVHQIVSFTPTLDCAVGSVSVCTTSGGAYRVWETLHVVEAKIKYALEGILMAHQNAQR